MNIRLLVLGATISCFLLSESHAQSITIQYGTVESVDTVEKDAKHAGGALAGGLMGALTTVAQASSIPSRMISEPTIVSR